jgi:ribonuclease D
MTIHIHKGDLPKDVTFTGAVAVDAEMMGLNFFRDRLCVVQLSAGDGDAHLVQIGKDQESAPNLQRVLEDPNLVKIFHFARYDLAAFQVWLGIHCAPVYCTKTASRLIRTFTDKHGYRILVKEILGVEIQKDEQSSDWGADQLTVKQQEYAASDVYYLHRIKDKLDDMLAREGRQDLAQACFDFLPVRALLDISGWNDFDIFAH